LALPKTAVAIFVTLPARLKLGVRTQGRSHDKQRRVRFVAIVNAQLRVRF
jgi:hypothetical protein